MQVKFLSRFVAGFLIELFFYAVSSATGYMIFFFLGAILTAASLGMLPGLLVALSIGLAGLPLGSMHFFMLPVDFIAVFATLYGARHGWFESFRGAAGHGLVLGAALGLFSYVLGMGLQFPFVPSILHAAWLPAGMTQAEAAPLFSVLYHAMNTVLDFLVLAVLARWARGFFLKPLSVDVHPKDGVRRWPIRWKILVNMSLVTLTAGAILFFLVRGIYLQQMYATYGAVARNFVEAASLVVNERELPVILAPGGNETAAYRELFSNIRAFYARSDDLVRYLNLYVVGEKDGRGYAMTICDPSETRYHYGDIFWMDEDPYYRDIAAQMLDPKDNRMVGPVVSRGYWGWLMTIYKPLYDPDGKKVAFIGIDLDMNRAMQDMQALDAKILSLEFVIFSMLLAMIYTFITRQVIDPLKTIQGMLTYFREHREKQPGVAITSGDEFEELYRDITASENIILQDSTQIQEYLGLIQRMALRDELTGVQNHTAYENKLSELTAVILAGTAEFGIVMADMNGLKFVNDVYGHEKGDIALKAMSKALCDIFEHSPVYRIGGDEFVVVLTSRDYMNREALIARLAPYERVRDKSAEEPWTEVAMAVGTAVYDPQKDREYQDVFNRADEVMYENKRRIKKAAGEA